MATGAVAKSAFAGDELYQIRARLAFPLLVRQAKARQTIEYGDISRELGMKNPRNMNFVLGAVGRALEELGPEWGPIPKLTALVVNKVTQEPSEGISEFLEDPETFWAASPDQRELLLSSMLVDVYTYPRWNEILVHFGLTPVSEVGPKAVPIRGGEPEGEDHRRLKEFVAAHPEAVGLRRSDKLVRIEAPLRSGDEVDVLYSTKTGLIGLEVKAHTASDLEFIRGMYQCVKYEAVLRAQQKADQLAIDARTWLVVGRDLPIALLPLANTLGIRVVRVAMPQADSLTA